LTNSPPSASNAVRGVQRPRVSSIPKYATSTGQEAVELCEMAGLFLDPWEEFVLRNALGEDEAGKWAAFEVGVVVSRQNGKGAILEARELAGLFLLEEELIIHSAHEFATSLEHFRRLKDLVENTPDFSRRVKKNGIKNSHGEEGIELKGGQRIRFRTRTKGGARGFTGDCVIFDEAMDFPASAHGAILPTLSARSIEGNPQVWYAASAVDQAIHENGVVLARLRERGLAGDDPALAYFEWSVDKDSPENLGDVVEDREAWAQANPALGIRISEEHIAREQRSMDGRTFAVERLGIGDWPRTDGLEESVIDPDDQAACLDVQSSVTDPVFFAFDVTPDRSKSSIAVSGPRPDGLPHIEVVENKHGTGWVTERIVELVAKHKPGGVICDGMGPASSLIGELEKAGVDIRVVEAREYAQGCGIFFDCFEQHAIRHLGTSELNTAIKGAATRPLGDRWAWSRKSSGVDISPLVACTLALWGLSTRPVPAEPFVAFV
jgi:hypothetical protein